jgi:ADP-dependent NAD(P)H-hydrate dehydratase / NAD(P)H-hydrate epimerase
MIELLSNAEMAEADRLTIAAGTPGIELMEHAGRAIADAVARAQPLGTAIVVVAGPGNNGGDGFVAGRLLSERGFRVRVLSLGGRDRLRGDAAEAARRFSGDVEPASPAGLAGAGTIIDAIFGAGLARPVEGAAGAMIEAMNACGAPILAVDLPSGINGSTGARLGAAIEAAETVTFFRRKPGHLLLPGRLHCGKIRVADIGIKPDVLSHIGPRTFANAPELWKASFPVPRVDAHKYARGHALVVSGGLARTGGTGGTGGTGAARLAARGALRAGAGLVTIAAPREALAVHAAANLAVMVRAVDGAAELATMLEDRRLNAVVLGPGGGVGAPMRELVAAALAGARAVVLDADALTSFAEDPAALWAATADRSVTVMTPHQGEFSRVFKGEPSVLHAASKLAAARAAAGRSNAIVVLKGPDTVIAAPDGRAAISDNAPPWLATAGSGDVLSGMIAALLAQGMPAFEAACAAVWLHGEAGNAAGPGLISEDLSEVLPQVYRALLSTLGVAGAAPERALFLWRAPGRAW